MEPDTINLQSSSLNRVTPLSKYLALSLFVTLPFLGGWIGYVYAPEKVIEIEKVVIREVPVSSDNSEDKISSTTTVDTEQRSKIKEARNYVLVACLAHKYKDSLIESEIDTWAGGLIENGTLEADVYLRLNEIAQKTALSGTYQNGIQAHLQTCFDYAENLSDEILFNGIAGK